MRDESPRPTIALTSSLPEERLPRINSYESILATNAGTFALYQK
jgi:hypothetical protein